MIVNIIHRPKLKSNFVNIFFYISLSDENQHPHCDSRPSVAHNEDDLGDDNDDDDDAEMDGVFC